MLSSGTRLRSREAGDDKRCGTPGNLQHCVCVWNSAFLNYRVFFFPPTLFQCSFRGAAPLHGLLPLKWSSSWTWVFKEPGFKLSSETDALLDCAGRKTGGVRSFTRAEQKLTVYFSEQIKLDVIILIENIKNEWFRSPLGFCLMMLDKLELCLQHNEDRTKQLDMWVFRKDYLIQNTSFSWFLTWIWSRTG